MNFLRKLLTPSVVTLMLLMRLGISLFCLFLTRIVFFIANREAFTDVSFSDFFFGSWFDLITVSLLMLPYWALYLLPFVNNFRNSKVYRMFFRVSFHLLNSALLLFNLIDVEYFKYTSKRSTADLFSFVGTSNDMSQLVVAFVKDFWFLIVLFVVFISLVDFLYKKTERKIEEVDFVYWKAILRFFVWSLIFLILGRGGFGLRPTGIIEASKFTKVENTALVLNTPFTIVKTFGKKSLSLKEFMPIEEEERLFNPIRETQPQNILPNQTNVFVLILESFGSEYAGLNSKNSFTPFFDSILGQSLFFKNGFSNGKKSIEAVPSILASIPTLMDSPYISSSYGNNKINSLATLLKKEGYSSAFFHGATNGSMRFDGFAKQVGFDSYYGRKEYNNDEHFDNTWGILDEYFNPWSARKMSELKEPFLASLFTLSSHHPYYIPENSIKHTFEGPEPLCASLSYADYSLRLFFEEAKKQPWFNNTIFVLVADHTPSTSSSFYNKRTQMYKIPIGLYYPNKTALIKNSVDQVFQHVDIMPTILDLLNVQTKYYSFGSSYFDNSSEKQALVYIEGVHYAFGKNKMLSFSREKARNLYNHQSGRNYEQDSLLFYKKEVEMIENKTKAIIQRYSRDLIQNQTTVD